MLLRACGALVAAVGLVACGGAGDDRADPNRPSTPPTKDATPTSTTLRAADLAAVAVGLTPMTDAPVTGAIALATRTGDSTLYVAQRTGTLLAVRAGAADRAPVLDLAGRLRSDGERGLLGVAFSPDGKHLAVHYSGRRGETVVEEYPVTGGPDGAAQIDPTTGRLLFTIDQPQANHNGGALVYGPDGLLYLGLGDGGAANDVGPGHAPEGNGQSPDTFLGKIVRIDPRDGATAICVSGVRNPWRFSFDRATGDLWVGDVGQNAWEEIDWLPEGSTCGANLGWPLKEGTHPNRVADAPGTVDPVFETSHDDGNCAIVGGHVYRGTTIPDLVGAYVFADSCKPRLRALHLDRDTGKVTVERDLGVEAMGISSFGEDAAGNLYVLSLTGGLSRLDPA